MQKPKPFVRKPRKRVVSRSFRVPAHIDKALDAEAKKREWSKTFLIKYILVSWVNYNNEVKIQMDAE